MTAGIPPPIDRLKQRINELNTARNFASHRKTATMGMRPISAAAIAEWEAACDGMAVELDRVMYNHLNEAFGRSPW